jgi:hypothetical protein
MRQESRGGRRGSGVDIAPRMQRTAKLSGRQRAAGSHARQLARGRLYLMRGASARVATNKYTLRYNHGTVPSQVPKYRKYIAISLAIARARGLRGFVQCYNNVIVGSGVGLWARRCVCV